MTRADWVRRRSARHTRAASDAAGLKQARCRAGSWQGGASSAALRGRRGGAAWRRDAALPERAQTLIPKKPESAAAGDVASSRRSVAHDGSTAWCGAMARGGGGGTRAGASRNPHERRAARARAVSFFMLSMMLSVAADRRMTAERAPRETARAAGAARRAETGRAAAAGRTAIVADSMAAIAAQEGGVRVTLYRTLASERAAGRRRRRPGGASATRARAGLTQLCCRSASSAARVAASVMPPAAEAAGNGGSVSGGSGAPRDELLVYVNGVRRTLPPGRAEVTLLQYLRGAVAWPHVARVPRA